MDKRSGPDLKTWKEYRYNLLTEDTDFSRFKHEGDYITTRDVYDYLQENGLFNKDFKVKVVDIEKVFEPGEDAEKRIVGFKMKGLDFIIEVS